MFRGFRYAIPFLPLLAVLIGSPARAEPFQYTVTGPTDYYFTFSEPSSFNVRTYAQQYGIDSMLWVYDADNVLIAQNDDFFGLDSWIEVNVQPGTYRLRTGVCCGNPDAWYGQSYVIETNSGPSNAPTTTTTTTVPETTTTTTSTTSTTTTTTSVPETTTTTVWETTTTTSTTTVPETTTTTEPEVTTTWPETTVAPVTTVSTVAPATTVPVTTTVSVTTVTAATTSTSSTSTTTTTDVPATTTVAPSTTSTTEVPEPTAEEIEETQNEQAVKEILTEIEDIEELSDEEVTQLIENIDNTELTDEQAEAIAEVLSSAPPDVKAEFEATVNVFSGQFDNYVPNNSIVSVGTRRTLIATTASVAMVAAAPAPRRKP